MTSLAMEEFELMKDQKYRQYTSAIDKALKTFENYNDWPDLIASLSRLIKVIKDYERFPVIPRRIMISKRLAICMQKAASSGVHLKALDVYDTIFNCMGTDRLSMELFIFSAGLFPLLEHSSLTVKSKLITMYQAHFVPLGPRLLPGLSGFLSGVLPALEEGTDHFDRVNSLLENVCQGVGNCAFYGCIWQCVAVNAAVRLPAVSFVLAHINKNIPMEEQQHIKGNSIETMVKALCVGMQDSNALVQRTTLDLVLVAFPLHNIQLVDSDVIRLITAALSSILRRDMSLNRRFYSWLLGTEFNLSSLATDHPFLKKIEETPDVPRTSLYFDMFSKDYLIQGVRCVLVEMRTDIRPYRLLTSLMDRADVGAAILDDFLFEVFRVLYLTSKSDEPLGSPKRKNDIIKSANIFFNSLESWYIWQYLGSLFDRALKLVVDSKEENRTSSRERVVRPVGGGVPDIWEVCELSEFLLGVIPVDTMLTSNEHLINLLLRLTALLTKYLDVLSSEQLVRSLGICRVIVKKLQLGRFSQCKEPRDKTTEEHVEEIVRPSAIRSWIGKEKRPNETTELAFLPLKTETLHQQTEFSQTMEAFLKDFQTFFISFVAGGRIINNNCVPRAFEKLKKSGAAQNERYADELRRFLSTVITEREAAMGDIELHHGDLAYRDLDMVVAGSEAWSECFDVACGVLTDISALPLPRNSPTETTTLPPWVKTLLICCCYLDRSPKLQITAVRTFLDLILPDEHADNQGPHCPLLDEAQITYIQKSTNVVKIITEVLWSHLGTLPPNFQVVCTELLHKVLNTLPSDDCVERILGEALLRGDESTKVESLHKFIKLWTIGRELQNGRQKRCFQSCLLKVLDNMLLHHNSPLRLQTEEWLCQALMRGDIARLLDPLLLILLDPASARFGITHVSIEPSVPEIAEETPLDDTSKIYAISSVDGNVIYHVSDVQRRSKNGVQKKLKWRWKKETPSDQRVFAVTSLKGSPDSQLRFITEKNVSRSIELPRPPPSNVSLIVNPMNSGDDEDLISEAGSVDEVIRNARRFNPHAGNVEESFVKMTMEAAPVDPPTPYLHIQEERIVPVENFYGSREEDVGRRISREILDSVVDAVVRKAGKGCENAGVGVHPLHSHLLLYCGVYDSTRTLYAFNTLKNILHTSPRLFLCYAATSGAVNASYPSDLLMLLGRHRKSVFGRSFDGPTSSVSDYMSAFRSNMYLEVLILMCLNFARSYYPNLGHRLSPEVLSGNRLVQLASIEMLTDLLTELIPLVRDSGKGFAKYIATILRKCKIQKNILHCTMSSLNTIRQQLQLCDPRPSSSGVRTFTEEIIDFNDAADWPTLTEHSRAMQVQLLKLILTLIKLEYDVESYDAESGDSASQTASSDQAGSSLSSSYSPGYLIPQQQLFLDAVSTALTMKGSMRALHCDWTQLVTSSLPYLGAALPQIVMTVVTKLCINIEELACIYDNPLSFEELPADYALTQLEALTVLCHYCVLDSSQQVSPFGLNPSGATSSSNVPNPTQILNNLVHVFTPLPLMQDLSKDRNQHVEAFRSVRLCVLKSMPRIISSLAVLWTSVTLDPPNQEITVWGSPKIVRNQILEFLSPLSVHHGPYFLAAMAVAWHERRSKTTGGNVLPLPTADQQVLVNLLSSIKVLPIDTFVQTIHSILKQPPAVESSLQEMSLEVSVLELFYIYMQRTNCAQLAECWSSLLSLLRDSLLLQPPAIFLVLAILNEFVQRSPAFQEKKDQRDLQDITAKLIEGCAAIAGACLEQTSWLKRNLSIRETEDSEMEGRNVALQHSVQAHHVLGQLLAPLLDVSYGSQEKEKVATLLLSVMYNVTPYLKNHQSKYAASFYACSQLLANISGYPYTRKAWKKDAFDLLLDPALFHMEAECLPHWTTIVDNLMTHDQTTFNDLMAAPSSSYSLFAPRDLNEQRAHMLKRLAFVIMCSEKDQYCKFISPIQDHLSESLRLPQLVPSIQAQVFFCFRVLLLRMSCEHVDALWSLIITEMVQVFNGIEQELAKETDEFNSHIRVMSKLDSSWVVNSNNGLNAHGHPDWLLLTLSAVKLLDLAVLLPAHLLPQFQTYRWAFVGDNLGGSKEEHEFIPHVKRISKLMNDKYGPCEMFVRAKEGHLLVTESSVDSLQQLHPFFQSLQTRPKSTTVDINALEKIILNDFLEMVASSPGNP